MDAFCGFKLPKGYTQRVRILSKKEFQKCRVISPEKSTGVWKELHEKKEPLHLKNAS